MDALRSASFNNIDPEVMRRLFARLEQMDPEKAQDVYAQLWNHPDRFERISQSSGAQMGGGAMQSEDMAQMLIDWALRQSDQQAQPGQNLGTMSAPAGGGTGNAAVDKALEFLGTPYNFSHARPPTDGSLDCSQLVSEIYGLPPDVVTQGNMGTPMDPSQAKAGDLVFFDESGSGQATHVGIADGKGNIVHASQATGEVTVTPIADIASTRTWATSAPV